MAYQFSFESKSLWALGAGSFLLCLFIFFAGLLLGANWRAQEEAATNTKGAPAVVAARPQPAAGAQDAAAPAVAGSVAALPYEPPRAPAYYGPPAPQEYAAQVYAPRDTGAHGYGAQDYESRAYAEQGYAAGAVAPPAYGMPQQRYAAPNAAPREAASAPPLDLRREADRLRSMGAEAEPRVVSEAETEPADAPLAGTPNYSVQVGAFTEETEARRLLTDLEHKGYTPALFSGRDGGGRTWYAVRIGAYSTQQEASHAAQNFSQQERLKATVRPSRSL